MCWGCLGSAYGTFFQEGKPVSIGVSGSTITHCSRKARKAQKQPAVWRASWLMIGAKNSHGCLFPPLSLPNLTPSQSHHKGLSCNLLSWWMMQGAAP